MARKKKGAEGDVAEDGGAKPAKGKSQLMPAVVVAVGLLGGGYLMSSGGAKAAAPAQATPSTPAAAAAAAAAAQKANEGEVVKLDAITLNLADSHYLQVTIAVQLSKKAKATDFTAKSPKAQDIVISTLGSRTSMQLTAPGGRDAAKAEVGKKIAEAFDGDVLGIYFAGFVIQ